MTTAIQQLLSSFDSLPDIEKHRAAVEILRRTEELSPVELSDAALVGAAEELFLTLDAAETRHAHP